MFHIAYDAHSDSADGELYHPLGLCISHDLVFVADGGNSRIQIFDLNGKWLQSFRHESNDSRMDVPRSVAVTSDGKRLAVADMKRHAVVCSANPARPN